VISEVSVNN